MKIITDQRGNTFYLTYGDHTHFFLSNDKEKKGNPYHIAQIKDEPYYAEVVAWLERGIETPPAHTQGEWKLHHPLQVRVGEKIIANIDPMNRQIDDENYANAKRIVEAVNMHDSLVESLKEITREWWRQKELFPELKRDGWMEMKMKGAERLINEIIEQQRK
jgi:hypothetical protein